MMIQLLLLSSILTAPLVAADTSIGCYSSIPSSYSLQDTYTYQSSSHCSTACSSSKFFALTKGSTCYCGDDAPSGSTSDSCDTACFGYGQETCGGDSAYNVYAVADDYVLSSAADSSTASSSTTASSTTASSSTKTSTSSDDDATTIGDDTTTQQASSKSAVSTQSVSGTTMVIYSTVGVDPTTTATSTSLVSASSTVTSTGTSSSSSSSGSKTSKGSIIGAAVGGVVGGIVLIALCVFLFMWLRRRQNAAQRDAELADSAYYGAMKRDKSQLSRPLSNPFLAAKEEDMIDQRLNPVMLGRRRISEGSLADEADYSRKILKVANPDDDD